MAPGRSGGRSGALDVGNPVSSVVVLICDGPGFSMRKSSDLPCSQGTHLVRVCPALRPRPVPGSLLVTEPGLLPPDFTTPRAPANLFLSRLNHRASTLRCQRFVPPSPATTHDSLPVGGYPFTGQDWDPLGSKKDFTCWIQLTAFGSDHLHVPSFLSFARRDVNETDGHAAFLIQKSFQRPLARVTLS